MTTFQPFLMERWMSLYEQDVDYNLSESGVHPIKLAELLGDDPAAVDDLLATELNYPYVNGTPELRQTIAGLYDGATAGGVLVTVGAAEANYIATRTLLSQGDEIVVMLPNYMQIWGIAKNHGYRLKTFHLREEQGWAPDLDELAAAVSAQTRLIAVCNPNNPTGRALTAREMDGIVAQADRVGAWILADEVYSGAERAVDEQTPSFYGRYDRVVATGSMSKAYGLPGLRIGWMISPDAGVIRDALILRENSSEIMNVLGEHIAEIALRPARYAAAITVSREEGLANLDRLDRFIAAEADLSWIRPQAGLIGLARLHKAIDGDRLAERLLEPPYRTFLLPGSAYGLPRHIRVGVGGGPDVNLEEGLRRLSACLAEFD